MDPRARAYAILGLPPSASARDVRTRYRVLANRWHPDRFAADAPGQAEAAVQMRVINDAVRLIAHEEPASSVGDGGRAPARPSSRRLSREQVERMIASIGTDGPVDWLFGIRRRWEEATVTRPRMSAVIAYGVSVVAHVAYEIGSGRDAPAWTLLVLFPGAFILSMLLLPKKWVR